MKRREFLAAVAASPVLCAGLKASQPASEQADQNGRSSPKAAFRYRFRAWTNDELQRILAVCRADNWAPKAEHYTGACGRANWWTAFFALGAQTGLGFGQLLELRCGDVDLANRLMLVRAEIAKNLREQTLAIGDVAAIALADGMLGRSDSRLFPWSESSWMLHKHHRQILTCAGLIERSGPARVAILSGIYEWWAPRNWRDVPSGGAIVERSEPMSFAAARQRAKVFNQTRREHATEWAIVVATDGRRGAKGGRNV